MTLSEKISGWLKERVRKARKKGLVIGLSGGIDSAVTAVLAKQALGDNVLGLIMPCGNARVDEDLALKLAGQFDIKVQKIELDDIYNNFCRICPGTARAAKANLKPRIRMMALYYFANTLDYLVAGTGNKSEIMIGYFTKHGDGGCDLLPLAGLLKTDVRKLARELKIPSEIITRPPTAGLWEGQTDEGEIGVSYKELDRCLYALEKGKRPEVKEETLNKIKLMIRNSQHKRKKTPFFDWSG
ncbi:MAG: NAD(+) synthase [Candidatus Omnitrophota bacterium]